MTITQTRKTAVKRKLHSVHSLLIGREFTGEIETGKKFAYLPTSVALVGGKIELTGSFTVKSAGQSRKAEMVKATLLSTQGGIQAAPPTPKGASASMLGAVPPNDKPATDATGSRAYVAVVYFKLSAIDGAKLGLPFDLSATQLNARLNPTDDIGLALQFWFSVAVRTVFGEAPDTVLASQSLGEINKVLKA